MNELLSQALFIAQGFKITLAISLGGLSIGLLLGTLFAIMRYNNIGRFFIDAIISVFRGTPLILQLSFFYFILPQLFMLKLSIVSTGIITFGLNSSAYIAEIIRAGIESIPKGQFEAAQTLEIPSFYIWKDIILPQVVKNVLPSLSNEVIALLKESALISTIGGMDVMKKVQIITSEQMSYFIPLCIAGVYYYTLVMLITMISSYFETKDQHAQN